MNLKGVNVLVDGYNLELVQGTGIKTYGLSLVKALSAAGANVDILCSRYSDKSNPLLSEVLFFDRQNNTVDPWGQLKTAINTINPLYKAKKIPLSDFVIKQEGDNFLSAMKDFGDIINIHNCYTYANNLNKKFSINTKIGLDKKIDIWHVTYPLPITVSRAKKITTIHDLIPLKLPHTTLDDKKFFFNLVKKALRESALVLTVSASTKKDILDIFDVNPDKICVTYQPILTKNISPTEERLSSALKKYKLKPKQYILFVGAIEPKKNIGRLVDAYSGIDTDMPLVIVGKRGWLWEGEIGKLETLFGKNFPRKVKLLEYVSKQDLLYLYSNAYCFVFPSLYEGFGLPPLEAMSLGCPVITSNISSLPEVCGDAALYVDPYDADSIREKMELLLNNPELQSQLVVAGVERIKLFSMENYTKRLCEAYTKVI